MWDTDEQDTTLHLKRVSSFLLIVVNRAFKSVLKRFFTKLCAVNDTIFLQEN